MCSGHMVSRAIRRNNRLEHLAGNHPESRVRQSALRAEPLVVPAAESVLPEWKRARRELAAGEATNTDGGHPQPAVPPSPVVRDTREPEPTGTALASSSRRRC